MHQGKGLGQRGLSDALSVPGVIRLHGEHHTLDARFGQAGNLALCGRGIVGGRRQHQMFDRAGIIPQDRIGVALCEPDAVGVNSPGLNLHRPRQLAPAARLAVGRVRVVTSQ